MRESAAFVAGDDESKGSSFRPKIQQNVTTLGMVNECKHGSVTNTAIKRVTERCNENTSDAGMRSTSLIIPDARNVIIKGNKSNGINKMETDRDFAGRKTNKVKENKKNGSERMEGIVLSRFLTFLAYLLLF